MDTRILLASNGGRHGPRVTSHESPVTSCKLFRFTLLSKNASANHLESHSCKNKGLKVPCFHTLTKNIRGEGVHESPIATPLCQCGCSQGGVFYPTSNAKPPTSALHSG